MPADVIDNFFRNGIEEEAIDREVAALGVVLRGGESDAVGVPAIGVLSIDSERGDFDLSGGSRAEDSDYAERGPDRERAAVAEKFADLIGCGARGDVIIFGHEAEQFVADAAAGPKRFEVCGAQLLRDLNGEGALGGGGRHEARIEYGEFRVE